MSLSAEERALRAKVGAHSLHATHDPRQTTAKARQTFLARFKANVDPNGELDPIERLRRAEQARKAHFSRMALHAAKARREKKEAAQRAAHARNYKRKRKEKPPVSAAGVEV
jgi:hypothetical protein